MKMTYEAILSWATKELLEGEVPEANLDAWYLFSEVFQVSRAIYFLDKKRELDISNEKLEQLKQWIALRKKRIPLQHILGMQEFMGYAFKVNEHVLIPRQDTETLVEEVLNDCTMQKKKRLVLMDMCTGSGCIAISLKLLGEKWVDRVIAVDLSEKALEVAKENAKRLDANVTFIHSNLFENVPKESVDIFVSNPPYIPAEVIETLMPEVKEHEPRMALEADNNGLYFYEKFATEGKSYVKLGGSIYMEIGYDQGSAVSKIFSENGWMNVQVKKDLAGMDRVVKAVRA